jgi:hypothetical protein
MNVHWGRILTEPGPEAGGYLPMHYYIAKRLQDSPEVKENHRIPTLSHITGALLGCYAFSGCDTRYILSGTINQGLQTSHKNDKE